VNVLNFNENLKLIIFYCGRQKDGIKALLNSQIIPQKTEIKLIALPGLAKLEIIQLLKAFERGAKGVAVWGCADEDCLYIGGNNVGQRRMKLAKKILKEIGLKDMQIEYLSPLNGSREGILAEFQNWMNRLIFEN